MALGINSFIASAGELRNPDTSPSQWDRLAGQAWLDGGEKVNSYLIVQERGAEHFQPRDCPKTSKRTAVLIDVARARSGSSINAGFRRGCQMRLSLIAAIFPALVVCNAAMAQVTGMAAPTPTIGATSPLGIGTGSAVSQTGIPLGSTEIASPGVSPAPTGVTGTIAMPGSGTTCST